MKSDLAAVIQEWENEAPYHTRKVTPQSNKNGEYILFVSEAAELVVEEERGTVLEYTYMMTHAQSESSSLPSSGDVYIFKKIAAKVESRFLDKCSETLEMLTKKILNDSQSDPAESE